MKRKPTPEEKLLKAIFPKLDTEPKRCEFCLCKTMMPCVNEEQSVRCNLNAATKQRHRVIKDIEPGVDRVIYFPGGRTVH